MKSMKQTNMVKLLSCFTLQEWLKEFFCDAINEILNDCIMHSSLKLSVYVLFVTIQAA